MIDIIHQAQAIATLLTVLMHGLRGFYLAKQDVVNAHTLQSTCSGHNQYARHSLLYPTQCTYPVSMTFLYHGAAGSDPCYNNFI